MSKFDDIYKSFFIEEDENEEELDLDSSEEDEASDEEVDSLEDDSPEDEIDDIAEIEVKPSNMKEVYYNIKHQLADKKEDFLHNLQAIERKKLFDLEEEYGHNSPEFFKSFLTLRAISYILTGEGENVDLFGL